MVNSELSAVQIGQDAGISLEREAQLVGIQRLIGMSGATVLLVGSVLRVSDQRMSIECHVCPNLVGPAGF